jgi:hypothetical protein
LDLGVLSLTHGHDSNGKVSNRQFGINSKSWEEKNEVEVITTVPHISFTLY